MPITTTREQTAAKRPPLRGRKPTAREKPDQNAFDALKSGPDDPSDDEAADFTNEPANEPRTPPQSKTQPPTPPQAPTKGKTRSKGNADAETHKPSGSREVELENKEEPSKRSDPPPGEKFSNDIARYETDVEIDEDETECDEGTPLPIRLLEDVIQAMQMAYVRHKKADPNFHNVVLDREGFKSLHSALYHVFKHLKNESETTTEPAEPAEPAELPAKPGEPAEPVLLALQQIQSSINRLEQKYEELESKIANRPAPKTYADVVRPNTQAAPTAPLTPSPSGPIERLKALRKEQAANNAKASITLSTRDTPAQVKEEIANAPNKVIAEQLQKAISSTATQHPGPKVVGICKLTNAIRVQLESEEDAKAIRAGQDNIDWNTALGAKTGVKEHIPSYAIVVHGVPTSKLNEKADCGAISEIEKGNSMPAGCITKVTNLRRKEKRGRQSRSIILYLNDRQQAKKSTEKGIFIDYAPYVVERFCPQSQITQCYKCYAYGHQAASCKHHERCGKCGGNHGTKECETTKPHCIHCAGNHEAWHSQCPARIAEKARLNERKEHSRGAFG
jgi:hypothetical protein